MANVIRTDRDKMLAAAVELIEERGHSALSARELANRIGISTQPIYREFGDMAGLRAATVGRGFEVFGEYVEGEALDVAVSYVKFALEHRKLFDFLFRGRSCEYEGLDDLSHKLVDTAIIDKLVEITGLSREKTYRLHLCLWMMLHGLAAMAADNVLPLTDDDIRGMITDVTRALAALYRG